jgi:hypothetical protein
MEHAMEWYSNLNCEQRLKFLTLTMLMGEEAVASALIDTPSIDELFTRVAEQVYAQ